jgi:malate dehydrogenase (oxaloacetate-decarboxylating)(NADP+)
VYPTAEDIAEITELKARALKRFSIKPQIGLVTYSNFNFSSAKGEVADKIQQKTEILQQKHPDIVVDGHRQTHLAYNIDLLCQNYPLSKLVDEAANTLSSPNLSAANIAYNLMREADVPRLVGFDSSGPFLLGLR